MVHLDPGEVERETQGANLNDLRQTVFLILASRERGFTPREWLQENPPLFNAAYQSTAPVIAELQERRSRGRK